MKQLEGLEEKEALPNEDIREFDSHEAFSEQYPDSPMAIPGFSGDAGIDLLEAHVPAQPSLSKLNALRRVGIRDIERAANDYQTKVVGTVDTERKLRFQLKP